MTAEEGRGLDARPAAPTDVTHLDLDAIEHRTKTTQCSYIGDRCNSSRCPKHGGEALERLALIAEVRRLRALPVIAECRICKWCVGFGNVSRTTKRFVGTWHCEHPDAPKDEGSSERSAWSRPMATNPNASPPATCPLRGAK